MTSSVENSFIPKKQPTKLKRSAPARKIFILTIVAHSLMFAALLAAGASFLYKNYVIDQLEQEVIKLNTAVDTFSLEDFSQVQEFDQILVQATERVSQTTSIVALLAQVERVIAQPIVIKTMELERQGDDQIILSVDFETSTLDAALFQRDLLKNAGQVFTAVKISDVTLPGSTVTSNDSPQEIELDVVRFNAEFVIALASVLYDPLEARLPNVGALQVNPALFTAPEFNEVEINANFEADFNSDLELTETAL